ncbi:hypothetical protein CBR_g31250 [Chara braunii]|uniref:Uncharacterized protein n=1 Tax=Chara braunii TaxID=69332 RepID=A0A388JXR5_CHABU|nr:hypothetical protein CBR_g31250 [Chara braunii]|eukprot:GBG62614.1 hypothetical protein CBR_g31250 [Chara braunii]
MEPAAARRLKLKAMRAAADGAGTTARHESSGTMLSNPLASTGGPDGQSMQSSFQYRANAFGETFMKAPAMMGVSFASPTLKNCGNNSGSGLLGACPPSPSQYARPHYDRVAAPSASTCQLASSSQGPNGVMSPFNGAHCSNGAFQQPAAGGGAASGWFSPPAMPSSRVDLAHSGPSDFGGKHSGPSAFGGNPRNLGRPTNVGVGRNNYNSPSFRSNNGANKSDGGRASALSNGGFNGTGSTSFGAASSVSGGGSAGGGWRESFTYSSSPGERDFNHTGRRLSRGPKALRMCGGNATPTASNAASTRGMNYARYVKKSMLEDPWAQLEASLPVYQKENCVGSPVSATPPKSCMESTPGSAESSVSFDNRAEKFMLLLPSPVQMRDLQAVASPVIKAGRDINEMKTDDTLPSGSLRFTSAVPEMVADGGGW